MSHPLTRRAALGLPALVYLLNGQTTPAKARAKRVIYLFQSGGPSQVDLFDHKPALARMRARELPESVRQGQRLTAMTATQTSFPL
ncbi:MAG: DUF1501 domain-containing protein, partial [Bryobacteraceae bacterium]|nr:DUF1501 domain-containing protein [Bryobacteraceae bacterium]